MEFASSLISGIVTSAILAIISWLYAKRYKKHLIKIIGKLSGSGIEYIYKNDDDAQVDIVKYVRRSDKVRILSMRAFRLLNDKASLQFLLSENNSIKDIQVLLADPDCEAVKCRAEEFINIDSSYTVERYIEDIRWSARQVTMNQKNKRMRVRLHHEPAFARLLITDDYLFLSYFLKDGHGDSSQVYRINRFSPLYETFCRYFDWTWEKESKSYSS